MLLAPFPSALESAARGRAVELRGPRLRVEREGVGAIVALTANLDLHGLIYRHSRSLDPLYTVASRMGTSLLQRNGFVVALIAPVAPGSIRPLALDRPWVF
jgi:hypothetical protein